MSADAPATNSEPGRRDAGTLLCFTALLLFSILVRLPIVNIPFDRNGEGTGAYYGPIARNYLHYPSLKYLLVPVQSMPAGPNDPPTLYPHHPPLVPLLIAVVYAALGDGEWQTRLMPALFTVGSACVIFAMLRRYSNLFTATAAGFLFAAIPISLVYGGMPDVDNAQIVFFALLTAWAYLRLHSEPSTRHLIGLIAAFTFAAATDWPAFFLLPVLCLHFVVTRPRPQWKWPALFGIFATILLAALLAHLSLAAGDWGVIPTALGRRAGTHTAQGKALTWGIWFPKVLTYNVYLHTWPILIATLAWLMVEGLAIRRKNPSPAVTLTRILLLWAMLWIVTARSSVLQHEWHWWPLTPGLCIATALLLGKLPKHPASWAAMAVLIAAFAGWNVHRVYAEMHSPSWKYDRIPEYSLAELGHAIRSVSSAREPVCVIAHDHFGEPSLWYYADRPLKLNIWDQYTLEARRTDQAADLPYGYTQVCSPIPKRVVLPKAHQSWVPDLYNHLVQTCRPVDPPADVAEKFLVFELP